MVMARQSRIIRASLKDNKNNTLIRSIKLATFYTNGTRNLGAFAKLLRRSITVVHPAQRRAIRRGHQAPVEAAAAVDPTDVNRSCRNRNDGNARDRNGCVRTKGRRNASGWGENSGNARRRNGSGWNRFSPNAPRNGSGCEGKCENASGSLMSPRPTYVAPRRHVRPGECAAWRERGGAERQGSATCEYRLTQHVQSP
jgi:hypothetical protein